MARFIIGLISSSLLVATTACSSAPTHWQKEDWAKLSPEDAHAVCEQRAKMSVGTNGMTADDEAIAPRWSEYMKECMASRGYKLVRGRDATVADQALQKDDSRGPASVAPAKE
jgi:hypothetical protein